jgi:type III restriction enzyme
VRYTLKDYQTDAVARVLDNLTKAKAFRDQFGDRSQFSLSATTGAGKTVMAAAVIEALFFGSDEFDFAPDLGAVVLWFSDDPALNEQSRTRIRAAGRDELDTRLIVVPPTFNETKFRPGHVYFLNTQKLSRTSRLVRGDTNGNDNQGELFRPRPDDVQHSIYETIRSTIEDESLTLYFVLDEAHRGMNTSPKERTTIVQRLINGQGGVPPMPIVLGISATVERFQKSMNGIHDRTALTSVAVDSDLVQASGLLKDDIVLSIPAESGVFDTVLLKLAVRKTMASSDAWIAYGGSQQEEHDLVVPLLVVQVPDKADNALLTRAVDAVLEEWPDLSIDAFANVFGEHKDLQVAGVSVPYISPERVQDEPHLRVLFAKSAISTGWDCPRAEVLMSFRPATDPTHITQLLGRMIRTPLARRIPGNDILNSVDCVLPFFNQKTATEVATLLMTGATSKDDDEVDTGSGGGKGRRVLFDPVELRSNSKLKQEVWEVFESIPSETIPKRGVKPIKRLTALAHALATDNLIADAGKQAHADLHAALDGRAVQYKAQVDQAIADVRTMEGEELRAKVHGKTGIIYRAFSETADNRAIQDSYRAAGRVFSADLARTYVEHVAGGKDADDEDLRDATVKIAALVLLPQVIQDVEAEADKLAQKWLIETRAKRKLLSDERQAVYDDLEAMTATPQPITLITPTVRLENSKERDASGNETPLPTRSNHLLSCEDGTCPVDLNDLELAVLDQEMKQLGAVAWYRNPSRATKESLAIAYKDTSTGPYKALRPDFIFFSRRHDEVIVANIVDPHGHWIGDALPKLRGLAEFAEKYGESYGRIEAVSKIGDSLRVLDITKTSVRQTIRDAEDAKSLYEGSEATDY